MRISGVNPSDISILTVYMRRYFKDEQEWIYWEC
jgi:tRNA U34 5-carboxymethylaminomethyl modifying enzyme MnmG/GidA